MFQDSSTRRRSPSPMRVDDPLPPPEWASSGMLSSALVFRLAATCCVAVFGYALPEPSLPLFLLPLCFHACAMFSVDSAWRRVAEPCMVAAAAATAALFGFPPFLLLGAAEVAIWITAAAKGRRRPIVRKTPTLWSDDEEDEETEEDVEAEDKEDNEQAKEEENGSVDAEGQTPETDRAGLMTPPVSSLLLPPPAFHADEHSRTTSSTRVLLLESPASWDRRPRESALHPPLLGQHPLHPQPRVAQRISLSPSGWTSTQLADGFTQLTPPSSAPKMLPSRFQHRGLRPFAAAAPGVRWPLGSAGTSFRQQEAPVPSPLPSPRLFTQQQPQVLAPSPFRPMPHAWATSMTRAIITLAAGEVLIFAGILLVFWLK